MVMQYTITARGLTEQDQATLISFLKVLNLGGASSWIYTDEDVADVVLVDPEQQEGQEFVWSHQIGVYGEQRMVTVGENKSGDEVFHCITKPLLRDNLREILDELIDSEGHLISRDVYCSNENLFVRISA